MSHTHTTDPAGFSRGLAQIATGRRTLLKVGAAGIAVSAAAQAAGARPAAAASTAKRCYVLVLDGTRPEELDLGITPTLTALRDAGTRYPRAVSQPIMETIPNHVMMMTGVHPDRNGVPANTIYDPTTGATRDADDRDLAAGLAASKGATILAQLDARGLRTGTVLSKTYLYNAFLGQATYQWEPTLTLPITNHEVDALTMPAAISMIKAQDPHLLFINLGDIDRFGHADLSAGLTEFLTGGTSLPVVRRLVLGSTDQVVKQFVTALKSTGHWDDALVIVLADHSMDWSAAQNVVSLTSVFTKDSTLKGRFQIADNGGADLIYWTGPASAKTAGLAAMRAAAEATKGVLSVHTPAELRLGAAGGDLVAYARAGWRFSDPTLVSNPIPGNHGHPTTRPIPFFLTGGAVANAAVRSELASTLDVAPTIGAYFGVGAPAGGWEGRSRL
ncbi:alkaline phosphatase family protein [Nocardioides sp.]|uniref:alkaline phosphatase family protein n=1 Tax=Nocardioides sp. TaxID=35761 RepID=UPI00260639DC|nr:alkaline phosphatase family protein [Nocardioides sp.]